MLHYKLYLRELLFAINIRTTFVLKRKIRRLLVKKLKLNRPTSFPFITGDGFRSLAQHILDESSDFDPKNVELGDIIFLNADFIMDFFERKHPHIRHRYILITSNSDTNITKKYEKYIDEKIVRWYAKNVLIEHPKITPIPIGLMNTFCNPIGKTSDLPQILSNNSKQADLPKEHKISFGFSLLSGTERVALYKTLSKHLLGVHIAERNQRTYFEKMNKYSFTASPEGNGADCHRTWEALYLDSIPIVTRNHFVEYFKKKGLPILIIDNWVEVEHFDEVFLQKTYTELHTETHSPLLYMDHWIQLILQEKKHIFIDNTHNQ